MWGLDGMMVEIVAKADPMVRGLGVYIGTIYIRYLGMYSPLPDALGKRH